MKTPKQKLLYTAIYVALSLLVIKLAQMFIAPMFANRFVASLVCQILFVVLAVAGAVIFRKTDGMKLRGKGFREGMMAGILFWTFLPVSLVATLITGQSVISEPTGNVVLFAVQMLLVGVTEEVLFRAVLQSVTLDVTGEDTVASARKGILLAGLVFGLVHLTNMFVGVSVLGTVTQAALAIPGGILFGVIYFRSCDNIVPVVIMHAIMDAVSFIGSGTLNGATMADAITDVSTGSGSFAKVSTFLGYAVLAAFLMRKSKMEKAIEARKAA